MRWGPRIRYAHAVERWYFGSLASRRSRMQSLRELSKMCILKHNIARELIKLNQMNSKPEHTFECILTVNLRTWNKFHTINTRHYSLFCYRFPSICSTESFSSALRSLWTLPPARFLPPRVKRDMLHIARACAPRNMFSKPYYEMQSEISNFRKEAYKRGLK